jgi:hypothetical protein
MTNRYPLIINSISQLIEELPAGDNLDLTSSNIVNAGSVQASSLNVTGDVALSGANVSLGAVGNLEITGGTSGYVLQTDGIGNLSWVEQSGGGGTPGGSNTSVQFNDNGAFGGDTYLVYNNVTNTLGMSSLDITGGAISGQTGQFNTANVTNNFKVTNSTGGYVQTKMIYGPVSGPTGAPSITTDYVTNTSVRFHQDAWVDGNLIARGANVDFTNVSTIVKLGAVGNINITGGTSGYVLSTNGSGNLSWVAQSGGGGGSSGYEQIFLMMGA